MKLIQNEKTQNVENPTTFHNDDSENPLKWLSRKINSKDFKTDRKRSYKGSHTSQFIENFNEYYDKIELKMDPNNSFTFNTGLNSNPFVKHILEMKIRKFKGKEKKDQTFGRYLSEDIKRKIQENFNNNSFFSMNFCKRVLNKKPDLLEKALLEKINSSRIEDKNAKKPQFFEGERKKN